MWGLLLNENKLDKMAKILEEFLLNKFPWSHLRKQYYLGWDNQDNQYTILTGGDQLTVAYVRETVDLRSTHDNLLGCLSGIVPIIDDLACTT